MRASPGRRWTGKRLLGRRRGRGKRGGVPCFRCRRRPPVRCRPLPLLPPSAHAPWAGARAGPQLSPRPPNFLAESEHVPTPPPKARPDRSRTAVPPPGPPPAQIRPPAPQTAHPQGARPPRGGEPSPRLNLSQVENPSQWAEGPWDPTPILVSAQPATLQSRERRPPYDPRQHMEETAQYAASLRRQRLAARAAEHRDEADRLQALLRAVAERTVQLRAARESGQSAPRPSTSYRRARAVVGAPPPRASPRASPRRQQGNAERQGNTAESAAQRVSGDVGGDETGEGDVSIADALHAAENEERQLRRRAEEASGVAVALQGMVEEFERALREAEAGATSWARAHWHKPRPAGPTRSEDTTGARGGARRHKPRPSNAARSEDTAGPGGGVRQHRPRPSGTAQSGDTPWASDSAQETQEAEEAAAMAQPATPRSIRRRSHRRQRWLSHDEDDGETGTEETEGTEEKPPARAEGAAVKGGEASNVAAPRPADGPASAGDGVPSRAEQPMAPASERPRRGARPSAASHTLATAPAPASAPAQATASAQAQATATAPAQAATAPQRAPHAPTRTAPTDKAKPALGAAAPAGRGVRARAEAKEKQVLERSAVHAKAGEDKDAGAAASLRPPEPGVASEHPAVVEVGSVQADDAVAPAAEARDTVTEQAKPSQQKNVDARAERWQERRGEGRSEGPKEEGGETSWGKARSKGQKARLSESAQSDGDISAQQEPARSRSEVAEGRRQAAMGAREGSWASEESDQRQGHSGAESEEESGSGLESEEEEGMVDGAASIASSIGVSGMVTALQSLASASPAWQRLFQLAGEAERRGEWLAALRMYDDAVSHVGPPLESEGEEGEEEEEGEQGSRREVGGEGGRGARPPSPSADRARPKPVRRNSAVLPGSVAHVVAHAAEGERGGARAKKRHSAERERVLYTLRRQARADKDGRGAPTTGLVFGAHAAAVLRVRGTEVSLSSSRWLQRSHCSSPLWSHSAARCCTRAWGACGRRSRT